MTARLVILTGAFEADLLTPILASPALSIVWIESVDQWATAVGETFRDTRLLAFCTSRIVPAELLRRLPGPSYNVHPGPPCYPGRHPESWAAYDGASRFGATLHEMSPRVDEGAIIDTAWVDVPVGGGQLDYGMKSFRASLDLVTRWKMEIADVSHPLPRHPEAKWSGHKTSHAELEAMCRVDIAIGEAELTRRQRAFAQVPGSRIVLTLHGREFVYTVPGPAQEPARES